jgi:hypothetical protein
MMAPMAGGRKSFAQIDINSWGERLEPPESLCPLERRVFVDLISACPLQQFQPCDLSFLCRWCELEVMAQTAAAELHRSMVTVDGKVSPWVSIHAQAVKGQGLLALRLRLGPQSRANRAPKTQAAPMSYYERASLLGDDTDEEADPN